MLNATYTGSQRRIGITGGIASGKTSVTKYLKDVKNLPVIDADNIAKELLETNQTIINQIFSRYGGKVIYKNSSEQIILNKKIIRDIIFSEKDERLWLESLMHPIIINNIEKELEISFKNKQETVIMEIPLLFECKLEYLCSEIWVVNCSFNEQIDRLIEREKISREKAVNMIRTQLHLDQKVKKGDIVINNSGRKETLINKIEENL
tara:strand:+ start:711 stop:1331 length:621 start_codon:yes stop_codon:yes gene_type:complete